MASRCTKNREQCTRQAKRERDQQQDQLRLAAKEIGSEPHPGEKADHSHKNPEQLPPEKQEQQCERDLYPFSHRRGAMLLLFDDRPAARRWP